MKPLDPVRLLAPMPPGHRDPVRLRRLRSLRSVNGSLTGEGSCSAIELRPQNIFPPTAGGGEDILKQYTPT